LTASLTSDLLLTLETCIRMRYFQHVCAHEKLQ
jgi:hypothetical protein